MGAIQRKGALRNASSYRTVSELAVLVVAGVITLDLLAEERKDIYESKEELGIVEARVRIRENTLQTWLRR